MGEITMFPELRWDEAENHLRLGGAFEKREDGAHLRARAVHGEPGFYCLVRRHPADPAEIAAFVSMADMVAMMDRQGGLGTWHVAIEDDHDHDHEH